MAIPLARRIVIKLHKLKRMGYVVGSVRLRVCNSCFLPFCGRNSFSECQNMVQVRNDSRFSRSTRASSFHSRQNRPGGTRVRAISHKTSSRRAAAYEESSFFSPFWDQNNNDLHSALSESDGRYETLKFSGKKSNKEHAEREARAAEITYLTFSTA